MLQPGELLRLALTFLSVPDPDFGFFMLRRRAKRFRSLVDCELEVSDDGKEGEVERRDGRGDFGGLEDRMSLIEVEEVLPSGREGTERREVESEESWSPESRDLYTAFCLDDKFRPAVMLCSRHELGDSGRVLCLTFDCFSCT